MSSLREYRMAAQRVLDPLTERLAQWGVDPNHVTLLGSCVSAGLGVGFALKLSPGWVAVAAALRILFDLLDGEVARKRNAQSEAGAFLNDVSDGLDDALLYGGLLLGGLMSATPLVALLILGLLAELIGVAGTARRTGSTGIRHLGPGGKVDRLAIVSLAGLVWAAGGEAASGVMLWIGAGLALASCVRRMLQCA